MKKDYNKPTVFINFIDSKEVIASTSVTVLNERWDDTGDVWASFFK